MLSQQRYPSGCINLSENAAWTNFPLWLNLLPLRPFARIYHAQIKTTNLQRADTIADKQPPNNQAMRKLPIPNLPITTYDKDK